MRIALIITYLVSITFTFGQVQIDIMGILSDDHYIERDKETTTTIIQQRRSILGISNSDQIIEVSEQNGTLNIIESVDAAIKKIDNLIRGQQAKPPYIINLFTSSHGKKDGINFKQGCNTKALYEYKQMLKGLNSKLSALKKSNIIFNLNIVACYSESINKHLEDYPKLKKFLKIETSSFRDFPTSADGKFGSYTRKTESLINEMILNNEKIERPLSVVDYNAYKNYYFQFERSYNDYDRFGRNVISASQRFNNYGVKELKLGEKDFFNLIKNSMKIYTVKSVEDGSDLKYIRKVPFVYNYITQLKEGSENYRAFNKFISSPDLEIPPIIQNELKIIDNVIKGNQIDIITKLNLFNFGVPVELLNKNLLKNPNSVKIAEELLLARVEGANLPSSMQFVADTLLQLDDDTFVDVINNEKLVNDQFFFDVLDEYIKVQHEYSNESIISEKLGRLKNRFVQYFEAGENQVDRFLRYANYDESKYIEKLSRINQLPPDGRIGGINQLTINQFIDFSRGNLSSEDFFNTLKIVLASITSESGTKLDDFLIFQHLDSLFLNTGMKEKVTRKDLLEFIDSISNHFSTSNNPGKTDFLFRLIRDFGINISEELKFHDELIHLEEFTLFERSTNFDNFNEFKMNHLLNASLNDVNNISRLASALNNLLPKEVEKVSKLIDRLTRENSIAGKNAFQMLVVLLTENQNVQFENTLNGLVNRFESFHSDLGINEKLSLNLFYAKFRIDYSRAQKPSNQLIDEKVWSVLDPPNKEKIINMIQDQKISSNELNSLLFLFKDIESIQPKLRQTALIEIFEKSFEIYGINQFTDSFYLINFESFSDEYKNIFSKILMGAKCISKQVDFNTLSIVIEPLMGELVDLERSGKKPKCNSLFKSILSNKNQNMRNYIRGCATGKKKPKPSSR